MSYEFDLAVFVKLFWALQIVLAHCKQRFALAMWRNLKNVCRQPMPNKSTKVEDKNHS
jgi:hypothetical protein